MSPYNVILPQSFLIFLDRMTHTCVSGSGQSDSYQRLMLFCAKSFPPAEAEIVRAASTYIEAWRLKYERANNNSGNALSPVQLNQWWLIGNKKRMNIHQRNPRLKKIIYIFFKEMHSKKNHIMLLKMITKLSIILLKYVKLLKGVVQQVLKRLPYQLCFQSDGHSIPRIYSSIHSKIWLRKCTLGLIQLLA